MLELTRRHFLHLSLVGVAGAATGLSGCSLRTPLYADAAQCATALSAILEEAGSDSFALLNLGRTGMVVQTPDGRIWRAADDTVESVSEGNSLPDAFQPTPGSALDWDRLCGAAERVVAEHDIDRKKVSVMAKTLKGGPLRYEVHEIGGPTYALTDDFTVRPAVSLAEEDGLRTVIEELAAEIELPVTTVGIHFSTDSFDVSHGANFLSRKGDGTITDSDSGIPGDQPFPLSSVDPAVIIRLRAGRDLCTIGGSANHPSATIRFSGSQDEFTLTGEPVPR